MPDKAERVTSIQNVLNSFVASLPGSGEWIAPGEKKTVWAGTDLILRSLAIELHLLCHGAFQEGRNRSQPRHANLTVPLRKLKVFYQGALGKSRLMTQRGDARQLRSLSTSIVERLTSDVAELLAEAASTSSSDLIKHSFFGLEASDLSRRLIALSIGCLYLSVLLQDSRREKYAKTFAKQCKQLARLDMRLNRSLRRPGKRLDKTVAIKGKLHHIKFFNRPKKPFTVANIVGTRTLLLAPYKSLLRMGVANGCSFWAVGRVRKVGGKYLFEVEFEGAGQHAKRYWEDHLAYTLRNHYNLYPSALRMAWEFPDVRRTAAVSDLAGRIR